MGGSSQVFVSNLNQLGCSQTLQSCHPSLLDSCCANYCSLVQRWATALKSLWVAFRLLKVTHKHLIESYHPSLDNCCANHGGLHHSTSMQGQHLVACISLILCKHYRQMPLTYSCSQSCSIFAKSGTKNDWRLVARHSGMLIVCTGFLMIISESTTATQCRP